VKRIIAWIKGEPVLTSFLTLAVANLVAGLTQGGRTLATIVYTAILAALGATVRQFTSPATSVPDGNLPIAVTLIPETAVGMQRLGRHVEHDPRSRNFPVTARLDASAPLVSKRWTRRSPIFDQGQVGSCTGNAAAGWVACDNNTRPGLTSMTEKDALEVYSLATTLDSIPGSYPGTDTGSTGLAAAKALVQLKHATGYTHAFSLDDCLKTLSQIGPVMLGLPWHKASFTPSASGHVRITGAIEGGHELVADEIDVKNKRVWFDNSWNTTWGVSGRAYFTWADLGKLLAAGGDVTVPH
jgi:hypothetical protein